MLCQGEELRPWIEKAIGQEIPTPATFIGKVAPEGNWMGICAFANWHEFDVEIYLCSSGSFTRDFLRRVKQYAFEELGVTWVRCRTAADRADWIAMIERLGFVREGCQRGGFDGETDLLWFGIKSEEFIL